MNGTVNIKPTPCFKDLRFQSETTICASDPVVHGFQDPTQKFPVRPEGGNPCSGPPRYSLVHLGCSTKTGPNSPSLSPVEESAPPHVYLGVERIRGNSSYTRHMEGSCIPSPPGSIASASLNRCFSCSGCSQLGASHIWFTYPASLASLSSLANSKDSPSRSLP